MSVLDFDVHVEIVAGVGDWIMLGIVELHAVVTVVEVGVELMELFSGSSPNNENIINETTPTVEEFLEISWAVVEPTIIHRRASLHAVIQTSTRPGVTGVCVPWCEACPGAAQCCRGGIPRRKSN